MGLASATCGNRSLGMMEWQVVSRTSEDRLLGGMNGLQKE